MAPFIPVDLCPWEDPIVVAAVEGNVDALRDELAKFRDPNLRDLEHGRTLLGWAAQQGHDDAVKLLIEKSANVHKKDMQGRTPLLWAAANGHGEAVRQLLAAESYVDDRDLAGRVPLILGAQCGSELVVQHVLEAGALIDVPEWTHKRNALSWAAENGDCKIIEMLLKAGAEVDLTDKLDRTPMMWAAITGQADVVKILLQHGANTKAKDNEYHRSPFLWAIKRGHESVIEVLKDVSEPEIGYGLVEKPPPATSSERLYELQQEFKAVHFDFDWRKTGGGDILIWALEGKREEDALFLIGEGADINAQDDEGTTVLCHAAYKGCASVVKVLLESNVDPEIAEPNGRTALSCAAEGGSVEVVKLLLDRNVNLEPTEDGEMTPLLWAACVGHEEVAILLVEKGADIEATETNSSTALSWAVENGNEKLVRLLLEKGAPTDEHLEKSPVMCAVSEGDMHLLMLMLEYGADPYKDDYDICETPPLALAAAHDKVEMVKVILDRDAATLELKKEHIWKAIVAASEDGAANALRLLLKQNYLTREEWEDDGPLFYAQCQGYKEIVELLEPYFPDSDSDEESEEKPEEKAEDESVGKELVLRLSVDKQ
ncbi:hypothetical protein KJ359_001862 [Pestalotiopsis sp. 9143b]|nr:hypothetical protein KJ359_001862 [Pestalotiopsis sp. 9143b]